jgi:serine/threonine protein kinase
MASPPSSLDSSASLRAAMQASGASDDRPSLRYGDYVEREGWLQKKGKVVRSGALFGIHRRQRLLKLCGSTLQCYKHGEDECPDWEVGLQNADVVGDPEHLLIEIKMSHRVEGFVAETPEEYKNWYDALYSASNMSIKDYYGFVKVLGEGHFGRVLLAKDRRTGDKFAVKVIKKDKSEVRNATLIQRELEILRLVNHKNIVRLYDLFDTTDKLYFVLEYMRGGALYEVLSDRRIQYNEQRASIILRDVLSGLEYLHERNIVHRDVKPENILLDSRTWPFTTKLADFGLSNFLAPNTGVLDSKVGTPYFCAREVVTSESYGTKADLWSVGVLLFEMLSGRKPFEGSVTKSVLYAILDGRYSMHTPEWARISDEAKDLVAKLVCIDVDRRLSATEALQHPWIVNEGRLDPIENSIRNSSLKPRRHREHAHGADHDEEIMDET